MFKCGHLAVPEYDGQLSQHGHESSAASIYHSLSVTPDDKSIAGHVCLTAHGTTGNSSSKFFSFQ